LILIARFIKVKLLCRNIHYVERKISPTLERKAVIFVLPGADKLRQCLAIYAVLTYKDERKDRAHVLSGGLE